MSAGLADLPSGDLTDKEKAGLKKMQEKAMRQLATIEKKWEPFRCATKLLITSFNRIIEFPIDPAVAIMTVLMITVLNDNVAQTRRLAVVSVHPIIPQTDVPTSGS